MEVGHATQYQTTTTKKIKQYLSEEGHVLSGTTKPNILQCGGKTSRNPSVRNNQILQTNIQVLLNIERAKTLLVIANLASNFRENKMLNLISPSLRLHLSQTCVNTDDTGKGNA